MILLLVLFVIRVSCVPRVGGGDPGNICNEPFTIGVPRVGGGDPRTYYEGMG